jgi:hypothetical protein
VRRYRKSCSTWVWWNELDRNPKSKARAHPSQTPRELGHPQDRLLASKAGAPGSSRFAVQPSLRDLRSVLKILTRHCAAQTASRSMPGYFHASRVGLKASEVREGRKRSRKQIPHSVSSAMRTSSG